MNDENMGSNAQGVGRVGKIRNPWAVWGLSIITLGIYQIYWWYQINQEVRDYDARIQVQPGLAAFALVVPIAGIVSIFTTGGRIGQAQRSGGFANQCSGVIGFLLSLLFGMHVVYYQTQLNSLWTAQGGQSAGSAA